MLYKLDLAMNVIIVGPFVISMKSLLDALIYNRTLFLYENYYFNLAVLNTDFTLKNHVPK